MEEKDIIQNFSNRHLNNKTNNLIITGIDDFHIIDNITDTCKISISEYDLDIASALNIKIDLKEVEIKDIFNYILKYLKELKLVNIDFVYELSFNNKFDISKFQSVLREYNRIVQIIFINVETLSDEEQKLFNELYYYNSIFFNVSSFINNNFKTYFLSNDRVLDNRENYDKIELIKPKVKKKNGEQIC